MEIKPSVPDKIEDDMRSATGLSIIYEDTAGILRVVCHPGREHDVEIELRPFVVVTEYYVDGDEQKSNKVAIPLEKVLVVDAVDEDVPPPHGSYAFAQWYRIRGKLQRF